MDIEVKRKVMTEEEARERLQKVLSKLHDFDAQEALFLLDLLLSKHGPEKCAKIKDVVHQRGFYLTEEDFL